VLVVEEVGLVVNEVGLVVDEVELAVSVEVGDIVAVKVGKSVVDELDPDVANPELVPVAFINNVVELNSCFVVDPDAVEVEVVEIFLPATTADELVSVFVGLFVGVPVEEVVRVCV